MKPDLYAELLPRIIADYALKTSDGSSYLQGGKCPSCGKPELYTSKEHPWVLRCGRINLNPAVTLSSQAVQEGATAAMDR